MNLSFVCIATIQSRNSRNLEYFPNYPIGTSNSYALQQLAAITRGSNMERDSMRDYKANRSCTGCSRRSERSSDSCVAM